MSLSGAYSSEVYQRLACSTLSNSSIASRFGCHSPSRVSHILPGTRSFPPKCSWVGLSHLLSIFAFKRRKSLWRFLSLLSIPLRCAGHANGRPRRPSGLPTGRHPRGENVDQRSQHRSKGGDLPRRVMDGKLVLEGMLPARQFWLEFIAQRLA